MPGCVLGDGHRRGTGGHALRKRPCRKEDPASNRMPSELSCPNQAICPGKLCATDEVEEALALSAKRPDSVNAAKVATAPVLPVDTGRTTAQWGRSALMNVHGPW